MDLTRLVRLGKVLAERPSGEDGGCAYTRIMPRSPRFDLPGVPQHVVQRGVDRGPVFFADSDRRFFLELLGEYARGSGTELHAYCLMSNHVHLLLTAPSVRALGNLMQDVGRRYVQYVNRRHDRTGGLWQGRYKASFVQSERYLLACMRYVELNPLRAGVVAMPEHFRWSSYRANALGIADALVTPHRDYLALSVDPMARREAYRALFAGACDSHEWMRVREATQQGAILGDRDFADAISRSLGHDVLPRPRGRPRKAVQEGSDPIDWNAFTGFRQ